MNYFIIINDTQQGPFTIDELRQRGISSDTLVWAEGMSGWTPAWQVSELKPLFYQSNTEGNGQQPTGTATPPPPPPPVDPVVAQPQPQPQSQPSAAYQQPPRRSHVWQWTLGIVVVIAILMAVTNPSKDEHRVAIMDNITAGLDKTMNKKDGSIFDHGLSMLSHLFAAPIVNGLLDRMLQYHNYGLFSTTTVPNADGKDVTASFGLFGRVFTIDEEQVASAIGDAITNRQAVSPDDELMHDDDDESSDPNNDVQVQSHEQDTTFTDETGRAIGHAVVKEVTKTVKQKVNESTDSATASGIGSIIDGVIKALGL